MKNKRILALFTLIGVCAIAVAFLIRYENKPESIHSTVLYKADVTSEVVESIPEMPVPLAAPRAPESPVETIMMTSTLEAMDGTSIVQTIPLDPVQ